MRHVVVLMLLLVGCGEVKDDLPPIDSCTPEQFVRCNGSVAQVCNSAGDGAVDMECGAPGCNAGAGRCNLCEPDTTTCGANAANRCGADGMPAGTEACLAGCTDAPAPHCAYLEPNYAALADVCDDLAMMPALDIAANQTLDTNSDLTCTGGVRTQTGGPPICVIRFGSITIQAARTLTITGARGAALVADDAITVNGTIDASANGTTNGPGGGTTSSGDPPNASVGGGGAGFRTAGGAGGSDTATGGGAAGGAVSTNPADLVALVGGPRPRSNILLTASPGGGGGALTLIACRGAVTVSATGTIDAGGGGGQGGYDTIAGTQISFTSAAGGGAGGNIVLQGLQVQVMGQLYANGGAGGGGTATNDQAGAAGQDGPRTLGSALGGAPSGSGGTGGYGGVGAKPPGPGEMPPVISGTPGGGGGAAGFLQAYTPMGTPPVLAPSAVSPPFSTSRTVRLR